MSSFEHEELHPRAYTSVELQTRVPGIGYTLKHRTCVQYLIEYYCKLAIGKTDGTGEIFSQEDYRIMCNRAKCHDMDKVLTSLSYPQLTSDYFHRMFNGHHLESFVGIENCTKYDWIEHIMDCESAHYTKPDKPGNAYTFIINCRPEIIPYVQPYFQLFGLNENIVTNKDILTAVQKPYYESDLITAILQYIHTTHIHLLDGLSRIDDRAYMARYNSPVPYRHPVTQFPEGVYHQRPNAVAETYRSVKAREMIHGTIEAEMFDMDSICNLTKEQITSINKEALLICKDLSQKGLNGEPSQR